MAMLFKDPSAELDYFFDWKKEWLGNDTIKTFELVIVETDPTLAILTSPPEKEASEAGGIVTFWLAGGTEGETYNIICAIETNGGRKDERTMTVKIKPM